VSPIVKSHLQGPLLLPFNPLEITFYENQFSPPPKFPPVLGTIVSSSPSPPCRRPSLSLSINFSRLPNKKGFLYTPPPPPLALVMLIFPYHKCCISEMWWSPKADIVYLALSLEHPSPLLDHVCLQPQKEFPLWGFLPPLFPTFSSIMSYTCPFCLLVLTPRTDCLAFFPGFSITHLIPPVSEQVLLLSFRTMPPPIPLFAIGGYT